MPQYKTVDFTQTDNGEIKGYFSTWIRKPDSYGDVVKRGAFLESFGKIAANGGTVPMLWNHDASNLDSFIGVAGEFFEDEIGAGFVGKFDSSEHSQKARQLVKDGLISKLSFAYDTLDAGDVVLEDGTHANELRKLDLHEVSLVMYPANRDTAITEVKSGRRNSAKDEDELRSILAALQECQKRVEALINDEVQQDEGEDEGNDEASDGKSASEASAKCCELIDAINKIIG